MRVGFKTSLAKTDKLHNAAHLESVICSDLAIAAEKAINLFDCLSFGMLGKWEIF